MYPTASVSVIYQADPAWAAQAMHKREAVMSAVHACMGHTVRIQTIDGQMYEGVLVGVDGRHVMLQVNERSYPSSASRAFYNPAAATILPLVLFELLVIVLLS
ncbi:hypothetical protein B5M42_007455 [Paenibacillus athensensis]|uniref:Uncharacterized protein n=1 Tax=Paenibacillus athensensis TaxID=1967502 RepID=A0A4Y8Q4N8_9BACL|nr:hypothetical protein [Paenibacillus athensensis]MCD1258669.1 hypothetical protein [Paenibacillus athensensis]